MENFTQDIAPEVCTARRKAVETARDPHNVQLKQLHDSIVLFWGDNKKNPPSGLGGIYEADITLQPNTLSYDFVTCQP